MDNFQIFRRAADCSSRSGKGLDDPVESYRPLLAAWLIEMTLELGWYKKSSKRELGSDSILEEKSFSIITGISVEVEYDSDDGDYINIDGKIMAYTDKACARILKSRLKDIRKQPIRDEQSMLENICTIGRVLGLSDAEMGILCFAAVLEIFPAFRTAVSTATCHAPLRQLGSIIALVSGQPKGEVMSGLREGSPLVSSGIVAIEATSEDLEDKLTLLSGLGDILFQAHASEDALIEKFLKKAGVPSLSLENFPHLTQDIQTIRDYFGGALKNRAPGSNILFYGVPGTGKTECVKALAAALAIDLYEISFADENGNPISGTDRLRAYNLCQRVLRNSNNAILMFDEIEDVFPSDGGIMALFGFEDAGKDNKSGKAWINRTLERNNTPAIWVTNDADIDPAYLRRFDYSVRFSVPPQQVRMTIARHHLAQFDPPESWLARIASSEQVIPAQYERAAKVARLSSNGDMEQARRLVEQTLDRSASLLGQKRLPARNVLRTGYDLRFVNTSMSVEKIITGLNKKPRGTFCFYGPAGTGKSEFARHIADTVGNQRTSIGGITALQSHAGRFCCRGQATPVSANNERSGSNCGTQAGMRGQGKRQPDVDWIPLRKRKLTQPFELGITP